MASVNGNLSARTRCLSNRRAHRRALRTQALDAPSRRRMQGHPYQRRRCDLSAHDIRTPIQRQQEELPNLIADGEPPSAEVDVEEHLLVRIGPGPVIPVEYLHRHGGVASQVPAVYTALSAVGRVEYMWLRRVELELHDACANVADPSNSMRWYILVIQRDVRGRSR